MILLASMTSALGLICTAARASPPDTNAMPQLAIPPATSEEAAPTGPQLTVTVTGASDYIFRGVSQTNNGAAIFGAARVTDNDFYVGVGGENVNFHNGTNAEYDLSAGWAPTLSGFKFDLGVIRYGYIDQPAHTYIDTGEVKAAVSHDLGPATLGAAVYYTNDFFGSHRNAVYAEGRGAYKVSSRLTLSGAVGRQTIASGTDHTTWNAGATYAFNKMFALDLRYSDTDQHDLGRTYGSHFVAAIKAMF